MNDWRQKELDRYKELEQDLLIRSIDPTNGNTEQDIKDLWIVRKEKERIKRYETRALYIRFLGKEDKRRQKIAELFYNLELRKRKRIDEVERKKWKWTRCRNCKSRSCLDSGIDYCVNGNRLQEYRGRA